MSVSELFRFAQANAINDRRVIQLIRDNSVVRREKHFEEAAIRVEAARIEDGIFSTVKLGNLSLQFLF